MFKDVLKWAGIFLAVATSTYLLLYVFLYEPTPHPENNLIKSEIKKIEVDYFNREVFVHVHLYQPLSCEAIVERLKIAPLLINNKVYYPYCYKVNDNLVNIVYQTPGRAA